MRILVTGARGFDRGSTYVTRLHTHNIINLSETEDLITLMWANEQFDPARPDTFHADV